jgi:translation initiation factor RLI1
MTCVQHANVYMFDEPSSYLDVKQRLNAARAIRALLLINKCVYKFCLVMGVKEGKQHHLRRPPF